MDCFSNSKKAPYIESLLCRKKSRQPSHKVNGSLSVSCSESPDLTLPSSHTCLLNLLVFDISVVFSLAAGSSYSRSTLDHALLPQSMSVLLFTRCWPYVDEYHGPQWSEGVHGNGDKGDGYVHTPRCHDIIPQSMCSPYRLRLGLT